MYTIKKSRQQYRKVAEKKNRGQIKFAKRETSKKKTQNEAAAY